jgi:aminoglycoside/choline kinase family phosphotransferase
MAVHLGGGAPPLGLLFDVPKLLSELQFFRQHALEGLWQQPLTAAARDAWEAACTPLCAVLAAQPRYFCHRDYHGWTILVHHKAIGILDFQDARLGPQPYDLVSLLLDRGTPGMLGEEASRALIDYYIRRLEAEESRHISRAEFTELFEHVAVQRCLKAIGTFAYMGIVRQRQQYLQYIPSTLVAIKPLLRRYNALRPLTELLHCYIPHLIA